ncbi:STAS domain-containing protein [Sphingomonas sp. KR1UV-12]|uniref:STAS domain-containing protein n=1 Tax=Sphingomonas aurea TaxID=3063994 RepID=A0ABT9EJY9_9SPHN|nr:STAS domain-containing protein [Sphingomonas sp. KR1UV-12]MDP1027259.1 STAS domain-containing protein [Sphingomonas sp. KR1UV-12]
MTAIVLPAVVDLAAAVALAETLRAATGAITINGGLVERIGAAGIQLLLSARATAAAGGHALTIAPASAPLAAAVATAGASVLLASDR